jgi:hypothetical protein
VTGLRTVFLIVLLTGLQNSRLPAPATLPPARFLVTVTGPTKTELPRLLAKDFQIWEDGSEQDISYFAPELQPPSLGIIIDAGSSYRDVIRTFLQGNLRGTEYFLMTGDTVILPFGLDVTRLPRIYRSETTTIESVYVGLDVLKEAANSRKALVVVAENIAEPPLMEYYRQHAIRQRVPVYALVMSDGIGGSPLGVSALAETTDHTGGEIYYGLTDSTTLAESYCREIAQGLRNQYTIGYVPKNPSKDAKWRKLRVGLRDKANNPKMKARLPSGYYAAR